MSCAEEDADRICSKQNNSEAEENNNSKVDESKEDEQMPSTNLKRKLPSWMLPNNEGTNSNSSSNTSKKSKEDEKEEDTEENELSNGSGIAASTCNNLGGVDEAVNVKIEPVDEHFEEPSSSNNNNGSAANNINIASIKDEEEEIKPLELNDMPKTAVKAAIKVEKADATSTSGTRASCKYGIKCYRLNPIHRAEEAHPGDTDYRRPNFPPPPAGTPDCPYGSSCYRRNPIHFQQYNHPADTDFEQNYRKHCIKRKRRQRQQNVDFGDLFSDESGNSTDWDDYDLNDSFIDDGDSDYLPSNDEDNENGNSDEEFDDEIDKAEE